MYAKIFAQIYDGTLCTNHPWQALVTFQQMLVLADRSGNLDMTSRAISRRTGIPLEIIELGIAELLLPDPESRTPDEGGRRIVPLVEGRDWGWTIVNYEAYHKIKSEEDRREYHRRYYQKNRSAAARSTDKVETQHTQTDSNDSRHVDVDVDVDVNITPKVKSRGVATASRLPADWAPSDADVAYCKTERPDLNVARTVDSFRDYWHAKPGPTARKLDWAATWRSWVRNEKSNGQQPQNRHDERMARLSALTGGRAGNRPTGMFAANAGTTPALIEKKEPV